MKTITTCLISAVVFLFAAGCASQSAKAPEVQPGVFTISGLPPEWSGQSAKVIHWGQIWGTGGKPSGDIARPGDGLSEPVVKNGSVSFLLYYWDPGKGKLKIGQGYRPYTGNDSFENEEVSIKALFPMKKSRKIAIVSVEFTDGSAELEWYATDN